MTPAAPSITGATIDGGAGEVTVVASEPVTVVDTSTAPWTVTVDGGSVPVNEVIQLGQNVLLAIDPVMPMTVELSYAGGEFVQGDNSGLYLEAVTDFPVSIT